MYVHSYVSACDVVPSTKTVSHEKAILLKKHKNYAVQCMEPNTTKPQIKGVDEFWQYTTHDQHSFVCQWQDILFV